jgi:hypothetical protein
LLEFFDRKGEQSPSMKRRFHSDKIISTIFSQKTQILFLKYKRNVLCYRNQLIFKCLYLFEKIFKKIVF